MTSQGQHNDLANTHRFLNISYSDFIHSVFKERKTTKQLHTDPPFQVTEHSHYQVIVLYEQSLTALQQHQLWPTCTDSHPA